MANQARVDILMALRTTLAGNQEALAYLDQLGAKTKKTALHAEQEFDSLSKKIAKKFSAADIGFDILKGFGVGSGFAAADLAVSKLSDYFKGMAESSQTIEKSMAKQLDYTRELISRAQTPQQQAVTLQKELEVAKRDLAAARVANMARVGRSQRMAVTRELSAAEETKIAELTDAALEVQKKLDSVKALLKSAELENALDETFGPLDELSKANATNSARELELALISAKKFGKDMAGFKEVTPEDLARSAEELKKFTEEMEKLAFSDAINANNDSLRKFGDALAALDNNSALTDTEKQAKRVEILKEENQAIDAQIELLKKLANATAVDPATLAGQIRTLNDKASGNNGQIGRPANTLQDQNAASIRDLRDPAKHYQSAGEGLQGGINAKFAELGTVGDRTAQTLGQVFDTTFSGIGKNLSDLVKGTQGWGDTLTGIGETITGTLIDGVVNMFTTWIQQRTLAGLASMAWSAKEGAADATAKAPGALLTSISSFGVAAAVGVAALVAALAFAGKFADGGIVSGPGGPRDDKVLTWLSNGEGVLNARTTGLLGEDTINALNYSANPVAALAASPVASGGAGGFAGSAKETRHIWIDYRDRDGLARAKSDPRFRNIIHDVMDERGT